MEKTQYNAGIALIGSIRDQNESVRAHAVNELFCQLCSSEYIISDMLGFIGDGVKKISEEVEERRHSDDKHIPEYAAKLSNAVSNRDYAWKMLRILLSETELKNFEEA